MNQKEKAKELVDNYRMLLMNEDTDCGNEILCTMIAKQCALIAVDEIVSEIKSIEEIFKKETLLLYYWDDVKSEIEKL